MLTSTMRHASHCAALCLILACGSDSPTDGGSTALAISTTSLPAAVQGSPYSVTLQATGGIPPYRWSASALDVGLENNLPEGLTVNADGQLTGVAGYPAGIYQFQLDVVDAANAQAHLPVALVLEAPSGLRVADAPPVAGVVGQPYTFQFQAEGGAAPYQWSMLSGNPPDGLTLAADGTLSGTPTRATSSIAVLVTDVVGATAFAVVPLEIAPAPLAVPAFVFPDAVVGQHYEFALTEGNVGAPPSAWSVTAGALPPGLVIAPLLQCCAQVSGEPTKIGSFPFHLTLTIGSQSASREFTITVRPSPMMVVTTSLPDGATSTQHAVFLVADGGTPPYTWSLESGTLPPNLTLSNDGKLSGIPSASGTFVFTVRATDSSPAGFQQSVTGALSLVIQP